MEKTLTEDTVRSKLTDAGLQPTGPRIRLYKLMFAKGHRHVTAGQLLTEAQQEGVKVSMATVYNTLNCFAQNGLVKEIHVDPTTTVFDTNTHPHFHIYVEKDDGTSDVQEVEADQLVDLDILKQMTNLPNLSAENVDLVIRIRK